MLISYNKVARDHLSTSSHANIQVTQFYKPMPFITVLQNTDARVVEEFKGLILATKVWYEFLANFHFCDTYIVQFPKQIPPNLFIIPNRKNV